ncbi:hypothetical protein SISNIDRAFT_451965, partial [Sistotremastrum niveocremeum HHB9708]
MTLILSHWAFPTWTEGHHKLYYGHTARLTPLDESYFVVCMSTLYADPTTSTSSSPSAFEWIPPEASRRFLRHCCLIVEDSRGI